MAFPIVLSNADVHIWEVCLDVPSSELERLSNSLSLDEKKRAERFFFEQDRNHFIVARGALRHILARYLDASASELNFAYGEHGKPFLINQKGDRQLEFNLSHSKGLALYAVALNQAVGIDIELFDRDVDGMGLAQRFFHPKEFEALSRLPGRLQQPSFFNYWVLKEAVIKAMGNGLFLGLDQFVITHLPGKLPELLELEGSIDKAADWTAYSIEVAKGYQAAVVIWGKISRLRMFNEFIS